MTKPSWQDYGTYDESAYPEYWDGVVGAWCPSLGPTGSRLFDHSRFNNWGTLTNMDNATDWVVDGGQYALDFDGTNDLVDIGNNSFANFGTRPFTVALWLKAAAFAATTAVLAKDDWDLGTSGLLIYSDTGTPNVIFFYSSGTTGNQFGAIADSTWHHIAVSRQSTASNATQMFLDGRSILTITDSLSYSNSRRLRIGNDDDGNRSFPGRIDDVQIRHRALTANEVRDLYLLGRGGMYKRRRRSRRRAIEQAVSGVRRRRLLTGMV